MHPEHHRSDRIGWLRAALLGANDGLISTGSLVVGVAAAQSGRREVVIAALAGLVAGAVSMAAGEAGEYVSVRSQADTERADLEQERQELAENPEAERAELVGIYVGRGLTPALASEVAGQLMAHDALGAHARDELGLFELTRARPLQAALTSAASFAAGALAPLLLAVAAPLAALSWIVAAKWLALLAVMGSAAARVGGAPPGGGAVRVMFWGAMAMGCTALVGRFFGAAI